MLLTSMHVPTCVRLPRDSKDVACAFPAADEFLAAVEQANQSDPFVNDHRFSARVPMCDRHVFTAVLSHDHDRFMGDLEDDSIDDYLKFCERVLVRPREGGKNLERL